MFNGYFGDFLLRHKLIDITRLKDALSVLSESNARLGVLAMEAELMTARQVEEVHVLQRSMDRRFGEIAVELGYLTRDHLEELLRWQSLGHLTLAQVLVDRGWFSLEEIQSALTRYKSDAGFSDQEFDALMRNDVDTVVATLLRSQGAAFNTTFQAGLRSYVLRSGVLQDLVALFVRNVIRFIDIEVFVSGASCSPSVESEWAVIQRIDGALPLATAITGSAEGLAAFGSRFADMAIEALDPMAQDAVGGFLNCHNGLFLSKLSNEGMELDLMPPAAMAKSLMETDETIFVIPFTLPFGEFRFLVGRGVTSIS